jgi:uncharacterized membrane protein YhiD involved in acid resistance
LFTELQNSEFFPITAVQIITNIVVALLCGLFIAWLYRRTYKGPGYSTTFVNSLILMSMITALVILSIGSNLARAFGLVGAMSIIRFRTAIKDTQDIVYIFFALAVGMTAGVGYNKLAIIGTLSVGAMIYLLSKGEAFGTWKSEYLLQFAYSGAGEDQGFIPVFRKHCKQHKVINTRSMGSDSQALEISYYVQLRDKEKNGDFVRELRGVQGVSKINLYFDEEPL